MAKSYTYIDLFAGCGGLSLGLHNAGWKGLFAIEKSPDAFKTLKHNLIDKLNHFNFPEWLTPEHHDINEVLKKHKSELQKLNGKVDMVAGGPPCQGFSTAGSRNESDSRNELIHSYLEFIKLVKPKIIFFENVKGFTMKFSQNKTKGKKYSEFVKTELVKIGYNVEGNIIDFSKFGVPQKRNRFILIGVRKDLVKTDVKSFLKTIKKNKTEFLVSKGLSITTGLSQAISDLLKSNGTADTPDSKGFQSGLYAAPKTKYQKFLKQDLQIEIPDSHRFAKHNAETEKLFSTLLKVAPRNKRIEGDERKKYNIKKRALIALGKNSPCRVLTSHPDDYIHFSEPRILTVREYARIQSFPDWYEFKGKYTTGGKLRKLEVPRYTQLGNAIPPLFGEQAGLALISLFNNG
jgi:DNA (cytosine-5)-methyltransferase 1